MRRYKVWDKKEPIYTIGHDEEGHYYHSAEDYINHHAPWAANPNVKVIVGGGNINGTVFMEWEATMEVYTAQGFVIPEGATDDEILLALEEFENTPSPGAGLPTAEERIAAALEFSNLLQM